MSFWKKNRNKTRSEKIKPVKSTQRHESSIHPRCWPSLPPDSKKKVVNPFNDKEIEEEK